MKKPYDHNRVLDKDLPDKFCSECDKKLKRKKRTDGILEAVCVFMLRLTCPGECGKIRSSRIRKETAEIREAREKKAKAIISKAYECFNFPKMRGRENNARG